MSGNNSRREKGMGAVYQRDENLWEGRLKIGLKPNGSPKYKYFSGKTESVVKKKIRDYLKDENREENTKKVSVETYTNNWLKLYKVPSLKRSSYDRLENTAKYQVFPYIGSIQLNQLTSDDVQEMLTKLQKNGASYSVVKKAYDCINAVVKHALAVGDLDRNVMLPVQKPSSVQFEQREIRYFTKKEAAQIIEESARTYSTGALVYIYGDAYVLALSTGLREGELAALKKTDYNAEENTLHVQRTIVSVKKRNENGESSGYELVENPTKTYSGDRTIHLNKRATEAIQRMVARYPDSEYIVCNSKGKPIPPANMTRTLHRMLDHLGIERAGMHALRHTFATTLFANGVDVKTVSEILGHANVQITMNIYIHVIDEIKKKAVETLDDIF
jgi:integrase